MRTLGSTFSSEDHKYICICVPQINFVYIDRRLLILLQTACHLMHATSTNCIDMMDAYTYEVRTYVSAFERMVPQFFVVTCVQLFSPRLE
jgi:hypothetical protein